MLVIWYDFPNKCYIGLKTEKCDSAIVQYELNKKVFQLNHSIIASNIFSKSIVVSLTFFYGRYCNTSPQLNIFCVQEVIYFQNKLYIFFFPVVTSF